MKSLLVALFLAFALCLNGQKVLNVRYDATQSQIAMGNGVTIPSIPAGYTLWLPKTGSAKGMLVFFFANRDSLQQDLLIKSAMKNRLAVIFMTTENPLEFLFEEKKTRRLAEDIQRVCSNFKIPKDNLLFAGSSLAGTRALKVAIFTRQTDEFKDISPKAIAIADVPLDMNRFYGACQTDLENEIKDYEMAGNFSAMSYLADHLDGTPANSKARYTSYSPYTKTVKNGGNAGYFRDMYVRAYIDSNINWTHEKHGKNAYDLANFVNQLNLLGSERAQLIQVSPRKKIKTSWDIVDEKELVEWFSRIVSRTE